MSVTTEIDLEINHNSLTFRATCPLCRSKFRPEVGAWVFVAGTTKPVCSDCIDNHGLRLALSYTREVQI